MRRMGIEALYRRPNTTKPAPGTRSTRTCCATGDRAANQVWAMDITYIPMARGFVYLVAVMDWFSRRVLAWRLSITLEAEFCVEAVEEAWPVTASRRSSTPTRAASSPARLHRPAAGATRSRISMDGRGAWRDNVFVERLWRSVKYEEVYLRAYDSVSEARASLGRYLAFYNGTAALEPGGSDARPGLL